MLINENERKKILSIKSNFVKEEQESKLLEEIFELEEALRNLEEEYSTIEQDNTNKLVNSVLEEVTDCVILALQINKTRSTVKIIDKLILSSPHIHSYLLTPQVLKGMFNYKLDRTQKRIQEGIYKSKYKK